MIYCQGTFGFGSELMQHLKSSELTFKEQIYRFSNTAFFRLASALESRVLQIPSDPEEDEKVEKKWWMFGEERLSVFQLPHPHFGGHRSNEPCKGSPQSSLLSLCSDKAVDESLERRRWLTALPFSQTSWTLLTPDMAHTLSAGLSSLSDSL